MNYAKKITVAALMAVVTALSGCAQTQTSSQQTSAVESESTVTESEATMENITFTPNAHSTKLIGRTAESENILWLAQSASGVEFTFNGTAASVTVVGDSMITQGKDKQARFAVYVDGERVLDEQIDTAEETFEFFSSEEPKDVTVKIIKLSEAAESTLGIKSVNITGSNIKPTAEKDLKIEFIGDSITCGYGVDDEVKENHFSTSTEDATKAYAYKAAQLLDADYSLVCYSGHGIISGYSGDGNKVQSQLVPKIYSQFAKSYGNYNETFNVSSIKWEFERFQPDFVVINLGTNDASYCGSDKEKIADYSQSYAKFLKNVRQYNPDAYIICALGVMGDSLFGGVEEAVRLYTEETGDTKISALRLTPQNGSTGYAADWHPTAATHDIAAQELAAEVQRIMAE